MKCLPLRRHVGVPPPAWHGRSLPRPSSSDVAPRRPGCGFRTRHCTSRSFQAVPTAPVSTRHVPGTTNLDGSRLRGNVTGRNIDPVSTPNGYVPNSCRIKRLFVGHPAWGGHKLYKTSGRASFGDSEGWSPLPNTYSSRARRGIPQHINCLPSDLRRRLQGRIPSDCMAEHSGAYSTQVPIAT